MSEQGLVNRVRELRMLAQPQSELQLQLDHFLAALEEAETAHAEAELAYNKLGEALMSMNEDELKPLAKNLNLLSSSCVSYFEMLFQATGLLLSHFQQSGLLNLS